MNIKCRKSGLRPQASVVVATLKALKYHGGVDVADLSEENLQALEMGLANLEQHVRNVRESFGISTIVAINKFSFDTETELALVKSKLAHLDVQVVEADHWARGGEGAVELAEAVVQSIEDKPAELHFIYKDEASLVEKMESIAMKIYGAEVVTFDTKVGKRIAKLQEDYGHYPVCVAKTPYSFSADPSKLGAPKGHTVKVREVRLAAGAEFVVFICGDVMTMPGLPKIPAANRIDLDEYGKVVGLF